MTAIRTSLTQARVDAAGDLEEAIAALRVAFEHYTRVTAQLEEAHGRPDFGPRLHTAIAMHLSAAGLSPFLARDPPVLGSLPSLRDVVARQHAHT